MAERSTRNKIRWQADKAVAALDKVAGHLQFLDELADNESKYIDNHLPVIVHFVEALHQTLVRFRTGL